MDINVLWTRKSSESWDEFSSKHNINLKGANLSNADLSNANLSGADLWNVNLSNANLSGADLWNVNLSGADLSGADLSKANLIGADLSGADLSKANLSDVNLSDVNLSKANLIGANLSDVNLSKANLSDVNLSGAKGLGTKEGEIAFAQQLYKDIKAGTKFLNMSGWHTCETTHCIAGWAFPDQENPESAASRLYPTLSKYFFASDKDALEALLRVGNGEESVFE